MSQSPADDSVAMGKRIAKVREQRGWKQKELADRAGMSVTFLSEIENGKRNLSSGKLLRIADELGTSMDYLARGVHGEPPPRPAVKVPPELSDAAEEHGWTYAQTRALLQTSELIRRSPAGTEIPKHNTKADWVALYQKLFT